MIEESADPDAPPEQQPVVADVPPVTLTVIGDACSTFTEADPRKKSKMGGSGLLRSQNSLTAKSSVPTTVEESDEVSHAVADTEVD